MDLYQLITEADGSEMLTVFDYVRNFTLKFLYSAKIFFFEHSYILFILLALVIAKTIITIVYGLSGRKKGKKITEVYDVCGEKYTYKHERRISLVRPAIEIIILVLLIKYVIII